MRGRVAQLLAVAFLTLLAAPVPSFSQEPEEQRCVVIIEPLAGFSVIQVTVDLILSPSNMSDYRALVDADHDGQITAAEVQANEVLSRRNISSSEESTWDLGEETLLLDQNAPRTVTIFRQLGGFVGPTTNTTNVTVREFRTYRFSGVNYYATRHTVEGGDRAQLHPRPVAEVVIIRAPKGWHLSAINSTPASGTETTIKGFDYNDYFSIVYVSDRKQQAPVPTSTILLVAVAVIAFLLIALLVRRRPKRATKVPAAAPAAKDATAPSRP